MLHGSRTGKQLSVAARLATDASRQHWRWNPAFLAFMVCSSLPLLFPSCSGRHALRTRLLQLGYDLSPAELDDMFKRFKTVADKKKVHPGSTPCFSCSCTV